MVWHVDTSTCSYKQIETALDALLSGASIATFGDVDVAQIGDDNYLCIIAYS